MIQKRCKQILCKNNKKKETGRARLPQKRQHCPNLNQNITNKLGRFQKSQPEQFVLLFPLSPSL